MDYSFLAATPLFRGVSAEQVGTMLHCLGAYEKAYEKGAVIFHAGDCADSMGLVLSGSVHMEMDDVWGNRTILGRAEAGQLFAETYACIPGEPLMVNVVASRPCEVLFLRVSKLVATCPSACAHHSRLIQNLVQISARKNLALARRSLHTAPKSIRGRLLSYLSEQAGQAGSYRFAIPFNRQQLADYLGVDRSALSNELSKMQREGVLSYEKNAFVLRGGDWPM